MHLRINAGKMHCVGAQLRCHSGQVPSDTHGSARSWCNRAPGHQVPRHSCLASCVLLSASDLFQVTFQGRTASRKRASMLAPPCMTLHHSYQSTMQTRQGPPSACCLEALLAEDSSAKAHAILDLQQCSAHTPHLSGPAFLSAVLHHDLASRGSTGSATACPCCEAAHSPPHWPASSVSSVPRHPAS